jgi:PAS domain S-box-containing protein
LIYINAGFTRITGYTSAESLGRNCRFLQGPGTDHLAVQQLRDALQSGTAVQVELLNYTKEGKPFWNKLTLTPVMENSRITHFIGIQEDITAAKERQALLQQIARHQLIADTTIEVQEQERNALANELHDNINQLLATVKLYLDIARTEETMRTEMIQRSQALTNNVIEEIRTLSHTLASPDLKNTTLKDAMEELIQNLDKAVPLRTAFHYDAGIERLLSHNQKLGIYRIVQEAFNNILKHAQPGATYRRRMAPLQCARPGLHGNHHLSWRRQNKKRRRIKAVFSTFSKVHACLLPCYRFQHRTVGSIFISFTISNPFCCYIVGGETASCNSVVFWLSTNSGRCAGCKRLLERHPYHDRRLFPGKLY